MRIFKRALQAAAVSVICMAAIALIAQTRQAVTTDPPFRQALLQAISVHTSADGTVTINVGLNRTVRYRTFELSKPDRLVLDLVGAHRGGSKRVYPAQSPLLERVRVGQWKTDPAIARVVADLKGFPAYNIKRQASGFRIELRPQKTADRPAYAPRRDPFRSSQNDRASTEQTGTDEPAQQSPLAVHRFKDLSASLTGPDLPSKDKLVPVTEPDYPASSREVVASPAVVSGISIEPGFRETTLIDIASTHSVPYRVFQLADPFRLVVDLKGAHNASRKGVYPVDSSVLKRVRVAQWRPGAPAVVRVVADLEGYPIFDVHAEQPGIRIELKPRMKLGPIIRNPFEYVPRYNTQSQRATAQSDQAMTATSSSPAAVNSSFSHLKVIGFVEKKGSDIQAVISDHGSIYFVPNGGMFENTFRVIGISPSAVEIQDIQTLDTGWLNYTR